MCVDRPEVYIRSGDGYKIAGIMDFFDPFNIVMWFVVLAFWLTVILFSRVRRGTLPVALLIVPLFFLMVGTVLNRMHPHPPWGTYAIALIHVMMLPALLRIAKARP